MPDEGRGVGHIAAFKSGHYPNAAMRPLVEILQSSYYDSTEKIEDAIKSHESTITYGLAPASAFVLISYITLYVRWTAFSKSAQL